MIADSQSATLAALRCVGNFISSTLGRRLKMIIKMRSVRFFDSFMSRSIIPRGSLMPP
jgi:hypothetical protein